MTHDLRTSRNKQEEESCTRRVRVTCNFSFPKKRTRYNDLILPQRSPCIPRSSPCTQDGRTHVPEAPRRLRGTQELLGTDAGTPPNRPLHRYRTPFVRPTSRGGRRSAESPGSARSCEPLILISLCCVMSFRSYSLRGIRMSV